MRHLLLFKHITDAADGVDELDLEWVVHFRAQPAHNDVNDIRVSFESYVPHVFCNLGARPLRQLTEPDVKAGEIPSA